MCSAVFHSFVFSRIPVRVAVDSKRMPVALGMRLEHNPDGQDNMYIYIYTVDIF